MSDHSVNFLTTMLHFAFLFIASFLVASKKRYLTAIGSVSLLAYFSLTLPGLAKICAFIPGYLFLAIIPALAISALLLKFIKNSHIFVVAFSGFFCWQFFLLLYCKCCYFLGLSLSQCAFGIVGSVLLLCIFLIRPLSSFVKETAGVIGELDWLLKFALALTISTVIYYWGQMGVWQRFDFDAFCYVGQINKLLLTGNLAVLTFDPFLGPPLRFMTPYIQNPAICLYGVFAYAAGIDPNSLLAIFSLIQAVIWIMIASSFAWCVFPGRQRMIAMVLLLCAAVSVFNNLFGLPYFVHYANPGMTGLIFILAAVLFHMLFHFRKDRFMLFVSFMALSAGLLCHLQFLIFAAFYWAITAVIWFGKLFKKRGGLFPEGLFLAVWIPVLFVVYVIAPKDIMDAKDFRIGTYYASYYYHLFGLVMVKPGVIFQFWGTEWVKVTGFIIALIVFFFSRPKANLFLKYCAIAALVTSIAYYVPGVPQVLVPRMSEVGFIRLGFVWEELYMILAIMTAAFLGVRITAYLRMTTTVVVIMATVFFIFASSQLTRFYAHKGREYVPMLRITEMPVLDFLKQNYPRHLLISDTTTSYWLGAQLPGHVYSIMPSRTRTYFAKSQERYQENEKIWTHQGDPAVVGEMVAKLEPAVLLLSKAEPSYQLFLLDPGFHCVYQDREWGVFSRYPLP